MILLSRLKNGFCWLIFWWRESYMNKHYRHIWNLCKSLSKVRPIMECLVEQLHLLGRPYSAGGWTQLRPSSLSIWSLLKFTYHLEILKIVWLNVLSVTEPCSSSQTLDQLKNWRFSIPLLDVISLPNSFTSSSSLFKSFLFSLVIELYKWNHHSQIYPFNFKKVWEKVCSKFVWLHQFNLK